MQSSEWTQFEWIYFLVGSVALAFGLFQLIKKNKKTKAKVEQSKVQEIAKSPTQQVAQVSWWGALAKTRSRFIFGNSSEIKDLKEAFEEACITSDLGVENTQEALDQVDWKKLLSLPDKERLELAKFHLAQSIAPWVQSADSSQDKNWPQTLTENGQKVPKVIWFVGVNGVGKTTSIAKLASELKNKGYSVMLAAADTFRAAAGEQLETWADRLSIPCVRGQEGSDSSAVLFDAIQSAKSKNIDFLLCDSAGRLHNQGQLMDALTKNKRVMEKALPGAPHEVLLVLDANTGQNMLKQAEQFKDKVGVTGMLLSKLDGTAKGGAIVAVARKFKVPIRRIGLGEKVDDFVAFDAERFSQALFGSESKN